MTKYLLNPLDHDITVTYNLDGNIQQYILPAEKVTEFDFPLETVFEHVRSYLVTEILNHRNLWHFDQEREKVRQEVTKDI
jgi:hypothetical protein